MYYFKASATRRVFRYKKSKGCEPDINILHPAFTVSYSLMLRSYDPFPGFMPCKYPDSHTKAFHLWRNPLYRPSLPSPHPPTRFPAYSPHFPPKYPTYWAPDSSHSPSFPPPSLRQALTLTQCTQSDPQPSSDYPPPASSKTLPPPPP